MGTLNIFVIWIGTGIILISLIGALIISKNNKLYLKSFFICPLLALFVSINSILGSIFLLYPSKLFFDIQSFLFLLDLLFWAFFFSTILQKKKDVNKIKFLLLITLLSIILSWATDLKLINISQDILSYHCCRLYFFVGLNQIFQIKIFTDSHIMLNSAFIKPLRKFNQILTLQVFDNR